SLSVGVIVPTNPIRYAQFINSAPNSCRAAMTGAADLEENRSPANHVEVEEEFV
ncbi:hypothetical protein NDU88_004065, partial [Pleurodeles waltl]